MGEEKILVWPREIGFGLTIWETFTSVAQIAKLLKWVILGKIRLMKFGILKKLIRQGRNSGHFRFARNVQMPAGWFLIQALTLIFISSALKEFLKDKIKSKMNSANKKIIDKVYNRDYYEKRSGSNRKRLLFFSRANESKGPVLRFLNSVQRGEGRLLDVGCGIGSFLSLAEKHFETYGLDISFFAIKQAKKNTEKTFLRQGSCEDVLPFQDDFFDVVTAFDLLEHLARPERTVKEVARVLRPGGYFVMSTPNLNSLGVKLKGESWTGFKDLTHQSIKPRREWIELLKNNGFVIVRSFYDYFWDTPYTSFLPKVVEEILFKLPTFFLFCLGFGSGKYLGENLYIIAKKK